MKKILIISDKKGRIQYNRSIILKEMLKKEIDIDVTTTSKAKKKDSGKYELIYYTHFSLFNKAPFSHPCLASSVTSHKCLNNLKDTVNQLNKFSRISVNNTFLFNSFKELVKSIYYTPNGVDTSFFSYLDKNRKGKLRIGWVGNKDRAAKRYNSILRPILNQVNFIDFDIIATSKKDKGENLKTKEEMRDYYHGLDYYLVTSDSEGTPNPALEAMSCGVPVISTRVGNMTEILENGLNGFFVKGEVEDYIDKLAELDKFSKEKYKNLRRETRRKIESWDWNINSKLWKNFFLGL